jgi:biopolymer transport protein ExbB/TolQ
MNDQLDSSLSLVRYIAWAIPAIGFVGTARGIGDALTFADAAVKGDISSVTSWLGLAFNSTLVGLMLCLPLMYFIHVVQSTQEGTMLEIQSYCCDHVVDSMKLAVRRPDDLEGNWGRQPSWST